MSRLIATGTVLFLSVLFIGALSAWSGSSASYVLLSVVFASLLAVATMRRLGVGYRLLVLILWVGFWLKLTIHMLDKTSTWIEPIGRFDFSTQAWDDVALVSSVGALAILCVGLLWRGRDYGYRSMDITNWYTPRVRALTWTTVLVVTGLVIASNEVFGIFHAGLRPAVDMPWPLHGLFGWFASVGSILSVMVLLHLDVLSGRRLWQSITLFLVISVAVSTSTYSRGTFVLQSLPLLATLYLLRSQIPWLNTRRLLAILGLFVCAMLLTVAVSQQRRADASVAASQQRRAEASVAASQQRHADAFQATGAMASPYFGYSLFQDFPYLLKRLSVDRWVGLEGVMSVSAYPNKGVELLVRAARERRDKDHVDIYTAEVSQSGAYDTSRYHFATLPGMFAFLYYSGSLWVVFIGTGLLTLLVLFVEGVILNSTGNPFLAGQVGFFAAILTVQMGAGGPVQPASALGFTVAVAFFMGAVVRYLSRVRVPEGNP